MLLALQKDIIYGPVHSRRLGLSLGINILPPGRKVCPFDCLYCQYGWTGAHLGKVNRENMRLPTFREVRSALLEALQNLIHEGIRPSYLTFSGNGEPTLHPDFEPLAEEVSTLRNRWMPEAKTAILSNSALVDHASVQNALLKLDLRIMKLDCGSARVFRRYNRPCRGIRLEGITEGLEELARRGPLTIQTLISSGKSGNLDRRDTLEWVRRIGRVRPSSVQIYTLDRAYPAPGLQPASADRLQQVRGACELEGVPAEVYIGEKKR